MANTDRTEEDVWIEQTLQGRTSSFSNIITKYQDRIYTFVARLVRHQEDAQDITQNVFYYAFVNLKKFRKECSLSTWLYRIAVNQVKNHWRNTKNRLVVPESDLKLLLEAHTYSAGQLSDSNEEAESLELKRIVNDLLTFLPIEQRQIFIFYYSTGLTCEEIAGIFKTSSSNIKIQLFRGREYLYRKFKNLFK